MLKNCQIFVHESCILVHPQKNNFIIIHRLFLLDAANMLTSTLQHRATLLTVGEEYLSDKLIVRLIRGSTLILSQTCPEFHESGQIYLDLPVSLQLSVNNALPQKVS